MPKPLYCIFNRVIPDKFCRIDTCKYDKEAWGILAITYENTSTMKLSKLQMLTTKFESPKMKDDKTFFEFYTKLNDIVDSCFNLGERILNSKMVREIGRDLVLRWSQYKKVKNYIWIYW